MATTAIFGAGVMGETLLSGLIRSGRDVGDLTITEKRADHATELNAKYGVSVLDNATAAKSADVLVLVVKPRPASRPSSSSRGCPRGRRWCG